MIATRGRLVQIGVIGLLASKALFRALNDHAVLKIGILVAMCAGLVWLWRTRTYDPESE